MNSKTTRRIAIVGSPNVGKSMLFNALTKRYVIVSNYPGTTVEVTRGNYKFEEQEYEVVDTPGMYSLMPITEEERVGRRILLDEMPDMVIHVIDAKNIERMLQFTLQLKEAGIKLILVLNIMDEARKEGVVIDSALLEKKLGIPVVNTVSITGEGISELKKRMAIYG